MHLLEAVASPEQQERYLRPLAAGEVRSAFAMTEPAPGAGSDPTMLLTTARPRRRRLGDRRAQAPDHGRRRAAPSTSAWRAPPRRSGTTRARRCCSSPADNPGVRVERLIPTMDRAFSGGHAVVAFEDCRVPADAVLGEAGLGYRYAQVRLAPARLTHCMRWLGLARRALDIALDRAGEREAFGAPLLEQGMVQALVADSRDRHRSQPRADPHLRRGARRRRARNARVVGREGLRVRGRRARRRPLAADLRRPRCERRPPARALRTRGARVPHLRRAERDASLVDRAARRAPPPARAVNGPVDVVDTPARGGGAAAAAARRPPAARGLARRAAASAGARSRVTRIGAGHSNATFLLERGGERMVLRRAPRPPLPPSAHDMLREARVLSGAAGPRARAARARRVRRAPRCSACRST